MEKQYERMRVYYDNLCWIYENCEVKKKGEM